MAEGLFPDFITPLETAIVGEVAKPKKKAAATSPTPSLRHIITLGAGAVTIDYPPKLTPSDVEDLHAYLEVFIKQLHRKADESPKGEKT